MIFGKKKQKAKESALPDSPLTLEDVKKAVMASGNEEQPKKEDILEIPSGPPPAEAISEAAPAPQPEPVMPEHTEEATPSTAEKELPQAKPKEKPEAEVEKELLVPEKHVPAPVKEPARKKPVVPLKRRALPLPPAPAGMEPKPGDVIIDLPSRPEAKKVRGGVLIKADEPELLRALVELVNKDSTVQVISALDGKELSVSEVMSITKLEENEVKSVLHRLVCLNLVKGFWYKSPSGVHVRKYKFETTKGLLEFDLSKLKTTLAIEDLKAKSTRLVALVTTEGKLPRSLLIKALPVMGDAQLDQVVRYTEKFKLP